MKQDTIPPRNYNTCRLSNGLRIIHLPSASPVVYCGYQIAAGTRNEEPGDEGLAHFCEHVTFKGTAKRTSLQIVNSIEQVGGELNAFTNKEDTVFYAAVLKDHLARAVDVLTDIVFHSTYPQHEILVCIKMAYSLCIPPIKSLSAVKTIVFRIKLIN